MAAGTEAPLTKGPIVKTLLTMTGQMLVGIFSMIAFNLVDTWFVGQLGARELAAMAYTFPVIMVVGGITFGLGSGASAIISRAIGEGDRYRVQRLTTDALSLSLVVVIVLVALGLWTMEPVFAMLGAEPETIPLVTEYMQLWYAGMLFVVIPMVGNNAIRATGDARTPSIIMVVAVGINAALDPLLIFGWGPVPGMGLAGAALATVVARAIALVTSLWVLQVKHSMLSFRIPRWTVGVRSWRSILYIGLPNAATNLVLPLGAGIITRLVSEYGENAVAAIGVAARIDAFALAVVMALSSMLGPFVGQNWGAGKHDRVRKGLSFSLLFSMIWGAAVMVLLALVADPLARLFNKEDEVVSYLVLYLSIVPLGYGVRGLLAVARTAMNTLNRPLPGSMLILVQMFVLYVPLAWLGAALFGVAGVFGASVVSSVVAGMAGVILLRVVLRQATAATSSS